MTPLVTVVGLGIREIRRTPVLVVLLFGLPAYVVGVFSAVAPTSPVTLRTGGEAVQASLTDAFPAFTTPMAAALVGGIGGLFVVHLSAGADRRLVITGAPAGAVVAGRLVVLGAIGLAATVVASAAMLVAFRPERPEWFVLGVGLATWTYALVGTLVGSVLDRLPGVYVVLFGVMLDLFLFQNPLAEDSAPAAAVLPGHFPVRVTTDAAFVGAPSVGALAGAVLVLVVVAVPTVALLLHRTSGSAVGRR